MKRVIEVQRSDGFYYGRIPTIHWKKVSIDIDLCPMIRPKDFWSGDPDFEESWQYKGIGAEILLQDGVWFFTHDPEIVSIVKELS